MSKFITILKSTLVLLLFLTPVSAKIDKKSYKPPQHELSQEKNTKYTSYDQQFIAENGSYRGQISKKTHRPKDTYVHGYHRKDGTYVRGHYKSKKGR